MTALPVRRYPSRDGLQLAYRELGAGRPLLLLHGFITDWTLWTDFGPAKALADQGFRVILPDMRGHGASPKPREPYPPDVLADDGLALIEWLGLDDYDLGGYSLGGRIALRLLARGARPGRAIVAGQGFEACTRIRSTQNRRTLTALVDGTPLEPGSPEAEQAGWIKQASGDPRALLNVLDAQVPTLESALPLITTPVLVVVGDQDHDQASADTLAAALPDARFARVPGNHFTAIAGPEFAAAVTDFLTRHDVVARQGNA